MPSPASAAPEVVLNGAVTCDQVAAIAAGSPIGLDAEALQRVRANRETLERILSTGTSVYGISTGFGALVVHAVTPEMQRHLQVNLLRSHAAGTGDDLPGEIVRAAMAVRCNGLLLGHSGVRPLVLQRVAALLNAGYVPRVPRTGSLGASGDLAPSAHAFLPLLGEGEAFAPNGAPIGGGEVLRRLGMAPLQLESKEGLALINGTHFMSAIGAIVARRMRRLLATIDAVTAATIDALRGALPAFDPRVHRLRPLHGQSASAANIVTALRGSARVAGPAALRLQDAYSLRCAAPVHGAAREGLRFFSELVHADLNAVTDNPIVFEDPDEVISAGNFHGQSLALAFDTLRLTIADLAAISERRTFRLVSPTLNGRLPAFLTADAGASSGYMVIQYTAAALVAELRALAHPVSVDTIPTSDNQEDHVSMGMTAALMTWEALPRLERVVAIELLCACQALDADPGAAGAVVEALHAAVRGRVPTLTDDRPPAGDLDAALALITDGTPAELLAAAGGRR
ncbi:MAG: aromatic amino acid lyase [Solirubrobacterales bacterium]|nr:aromatic amino acid lyase [Solirubrobacterales bacterium]